MNVRDACWLLLAPLVFVAPAGAATPTLSTLVQFSGATGEQPPAGLAIDAAGNLFGTTEGGGASAYGSIFKVASGTHALTTLYSFDYTNGGSPLAGVTLDGQGNLYGTTSNSATGFGTAYKLAAGTGTLTTLARFAGGNAGAEPEAGVTLDPDGNVYGTTAFGGSNNQGTIFKVANTGAVSTLVTFSTATGATPVSGLLRDATGNLYGTTYAGGASKDGTVFELAAGASTPTTLVTFNYANGYEPIGGLVADAAGNLFGTTSGGGAKNAGTLFEIAAGTHGFTTLATFGGSVGVSPQGTLLIDAAGNLFGTTRNGGTAGEGTVFEYAAATASLSTLVSLDLAHTGEYPVSNLVADPAGTLYGTTHDGPGAAQGTVFEVTDAGFIVATPEPGSASLLLVPVAAALALRRRTRQPV